MFMTEACLLPQTQLNNNEWIFFFKLFVPFFGLGILLSLLDISNIGANGPALVGECDQVVCVRIERTESVNATMM